MCNDLIKPHKLKKKLKFRQNHTFYLPKLGPNKKPVFKTFKMLPYMKNILYWMLLLRKLSLFALKTKIELSSLQEPYLPCVID